MHRFFVSPDSIHGSSARLGEEIAHQLRHVLRMRPGTRVILLDNRGFEYEIELEKITSDAAQGRVIERRPASGEPRARLTLYQCLLKKDNFEWVLQKGTEIGVTRFVPMISQRTVAADSDGLRKNKLPRWSRIIAEAAEQSGRGALPLIQEPLPFADAVVETGEQAERSLALIPWEQERDRSLRSALTAFRAALPPDAEPEIALMIGPEGGFAEEEIARAAQAGVLPVTMGPRILRAETAAVAACVMALYGFQELG